MHVNELPHAPEVARDLRPGPGETDQDDQAGYRTVAGQYSLNSFIVSECSATRR